MRRPRHAFPALLLVAAIGSGCMPSDVSGPFRFNGDHPHSVFAVTFSPAGGSHYLVVDAYTAGHQTEFWAKNTSGEAGTASFGCQATAHVSCAGVSPSSSSLDPGDSVLVEVSFDAGSPSGIPIDTVYATSSSASAKGKRRVVVE